MEKQRLGFAICGSFCTHAEILPIIEDLCSRYEVYPILSEYSSETDTRFGRAKEFRETLEALCGRGVLCSIKATEPLGPQKLLDLLVIAPCTGNTLAKLANGIADSAVTMAAKAHLRNGRPVLLGISTNDGLSTAARNIGELLCRKHYFFVPFGQDDPIEKPCSLVADMTKIPAAALAASEGIQLQPMLTMHE